MKYSNKIIFALKSNRLFCALLIALIGSAAYSNSLYVPFHFDDILNIADNSIVKDIYNFVDLSKSVGQELRNAFISRYVGFLTFALNYQIAGNNVFGYHLTNLAIHLINSVLLYLLILQIGKSRLHAHNRAVPEEDDVFPLLAFFTAAIFVAHPLHTQAVTYTVQRFTSLTALFCLLALLLYLKSVEAGERARTTARAFYCISLLSMVLAMKTKENAATFPIVIAIAELFFHKEKWKKRVFRLLPFFATSLIVPLTMISLAGTYSGFDTLNEATRVQAQFARLDYLITQFRVVTRYVSLFFWPTNLNLDYDFRLSKSLFEIDTFLSFCFLSLILIVGIVAYMKSRQGDFSARFISFGIFWFFIAQLVESSIIPIVDIIFEHRMYLPSVGLLIACMGLLLAASEKPSTAKVFKIPLYIVLAAFVAALGLATYSRNVVWQDPVSLWEDVAKKSPLKARPHNNLGTAYIEKGRLQDAEREFLTALQIQPTYSQSYANLGRIYRDRGETAKAISAFKQSAVSDYSTKADENLALAYDMSGDYEMAAFYFRRCAERNPVSGGYFNLGLALKKAGKSEEALAAYRRSAQLNTGNADAYINIGNVLSELRRDTEAEEAYGRAIAADPKNPRTYQNLAIFHSRKNQLEKAENYNRIYHRMSNGGW